MNKTKIEWTDYTWNPISGCPKPHCWYCYAKNMYRRFPALGNPKFVPKFFPNRLNGLDKLKKPSKIFVGSCADIFATETKKNWRDKVIEQIKLHPKHIYQLLTKRPQNISKRFNFGDNVWIGTTINYANELWRADEIRQVENCGVRFISFEPLLGEIGEINLEDINWVIIGKLTGAKKIPIKKVWVADIIAQCKEREIPVFVKDNLNWHIKTHTNP